MGVSKVNYGNSTLIDLTNDSVTAETLKKGETAHGADGELIEGTYEGMELDDLTTSTNDSADADLFVTKEDGGLVWVKKSMEKLWNYIKGKIGIANSGSTFLKKDGTWAIPLGDFVATSDVTISSVTYHTYWQVAPTASNQVYGVAIHPTSGRLCRIYNNKGTYSIQYYDLNTTTGTTYSAGSVPDNTTFATNGSVKNSYDALVSNKAEKMDLTNIHITSGTVNNTGSTITSGKYFYYKNSLVKAKTNIAAEATLTLNTNYETVPDGGLNALNSALATKQNKTWTLVAQFTGSDTKNIPDVEMYNSNEFLIIPWVSTSSNKYNSYLLPVADASLFYFSIYQDSTHYANCHVELLSNTQVRLVVDSKGSGWNTVGMNLKVR